MVSKFSRKKVIISILVLLSLWVLIELFYPFRTNLKIFDPKDIAGLETNMWRAYYEKDNFKLYYLLVEMLHKEQGFSYLRANYQAYLAAKAAVVFKRGHNQKDYELALPYLIKYYDGMKNIGRLNCNPENAARKELKWWIVHRERLHYGDAALIKSIADAAGALYLENPGNLFEYAKARAEAMIMRDDEAAKDGVSNMEWQLINNKLFYSYHSLKNVLNKN